MRILYTGRVSRDCTERYIPVLIEIINFCLSFFYERSFFFFFFKVYNITALNEWLSLRITTKSLRTTVR